MIHDEDYEYFIDSIKSLINDEKDSINIILRIKTKENDIKWINLILNILRKEVEGSTIISGYIYDVTENKLNEIALRESEKRFRETYNKLVESEERFRNLFEKSPIGISITDKNGKVLLANSELKNILGYTLEELQNMTWMEYTYPDDVQKDYELFIKLINREIDKYQIEKRFIKKDGSIVFTNLIASAIFDKDGNFLYEFALIEDITERKMLYTAIEENQKRFKLFFEKNPLGIIVVDENNMYIASNKVYQELLGYTEEELKNMDLKNLTYPEDYKIQNEMLKKIIKREIDSFELEKRYIRKDGNVIWAKLYVSAIFNEKDEVEYFVGMVKDITEEKRLRDELNESHEKLKKSLDNILTLTTKIIEMKDPYTAGHQKKVMLIATKIAEKLKLPLDKIESIRIASYVHDVGKIVVPFEILNKGGRLTESEMSIVKEHSKAGYEILKNIEFPYPIAEIVYQHHERLNGSGYPRGLKDGEIMLEARIVAVADVFEAMTSHRPYRPKYPKEEVLKELKEKSGILYDENVVNTLIDIVEKNELNW